VRRQGAQKPVSGVAGVNNSAMRDSSGNANSFKPAQQIFSHAARGESRRRFAV
jgi:hypothetical protein